MTTLHIEHAVTDFTLWSRAFAGFADRRDRGGVRGERISRPIDDPCYVVTDLDFDSPEVATRFLGFLVEQVCASRELSPALSGSPITRILERADVAIPH